MTNKLIKTYMYEDLNTLTLPKGKIKTNYIAKEGIYETSVSWVGEKTVLVSPHNLGDLPNFPEDEIGVFINNGKQHIIPRQAIETVIAWYIHVTEKTGEEAQVNFYVSNGKTTLDTDSGTIDLNSLPGIYFWNNNIFSYTPKQKNSSGLTSSIDPIYNLLNTQYGMFVETHSHNSMTAFKSKEDEANSNNDAVQLVFGKLDKTDYQMYSWVTIRGTQIDGLFSEELSKFVELPPQKNQLKSIQSSGIKHEFSALDLTNAKESLFQIWDAQVVHSTRGKVKVKKAFDNIYYQTPTNKKGKKGKGNKKNKKGKHSIITKSSFNSDDSAYYKTHLVSNNNILTLYLKELKDFNKQFNVEIQSHIDFNEIIRNWNYSTYNTNFNKCRKSLVLEFQRMLKTL